MNKARVEKILARLKEPGVLISYNTEEKHPVECKVTSYACNDCSSEVIANRMVSPFCPSCSGDLKQSSNKVMSFNKDDFKKLKPLVECTACASSFVTNDSTLKALANVSFNCPVCTSEIKASAAPMNEDSDESSEDTSDDSNVTDVSEDDSDNSTDENNSVDDDPADDSEVSLDENEDSSDEDDTDADIDEVMNNLSPDTDNTDTSNDVADNNAAANSAPTPPVDDTEENNSNEEDDDNSSDDNDENKKEDDNSAITAAFFKAALKNTKKFDLIHASNYNHWYLIGDGTTPLAVAAFDNASTEIQPVFRSDSYKNAFESSKEADGGINPGLLEDFGFTPVDVNVDMDDVTNQHIKDEVSKKTEELKNKIEEIEEVTSQCLGIAVMADIKGIYPMSTSIRTPLINKLSSLKVRNPDAVVDEVLSKFMPEYMKSLVVKASELANKDESSLAAVAEMVTSAEARTPITASNKSENNGTVLPFSVVAEANNSSNLENSNLNSREDVVATAKAPNHDLKQVIGSLRRPSSGRR